MEQNISVLMNGTHFKILVVVNILTLIAVGVVYINLPPERPETERLVQMVVAQDWLIGKMSMQVRELTVENVEYSFGKKRTVQQQALEDAIIAYEKSRTELGLDLDASRKSLEADYQVLEKTYGDGPSDFELDEKKELD